MWLNWDLTHIFPLFPFDLRDHKGTLGRKGLKANTVLMF